MRMFAVLLTALQLAGLSHALQCKAVKGDNNWPAETVWREELPGVIPTAAKPGNVSSTDYTLVARSVSDVEAAVTFAAKHNVRLTITNSGSDFLGRCDAGSGLWLSVGNLKGLRVSEDFAPSITQASTSLNYSADPMASANVIQLAPGKQTAYAIIGTGVSGQELTDALSKSGLFAIVPAYASVKVAGGFGLNGGHSPFSSLHGLGSDQFVEYKVVTADGVLKIANMDVNPDLFWALKGGGGGFGVVVEATIKVFPSPKITMARWYLKTSGVNDTKSIYGPAAFIMSQMPALNAKGVQGYFYIYPTSMWAYFLTADGDAGIEKAQRLWDPVLTAASAFPGVSKPITQYANFDSFKQFFDWRFGPAKQSAPEKATSRGISPMDSRLLPTAALTNLKLSAALRDAMPVGRNAMLRGHLVAGGMVAKLAETSSANNAWRRAMVHVSATGPSPNATSLKLLTPESGCYVNECSTRETNFRKTYFGSNYDALYEIKQKYDPNGVFWATPSVGADDWSLGENHRLCKVEAKGLPNILGLPPSTDNTNFAPNSMNMYSEFPASQEQADKETPKLGHW